MLNIDATRRDGQRPTRRTFLQLSSLAPASLAVSQALAAQSLASGRPLGFGRAKRCIVVFLFGGPSQLDTWDMKPEAPAEIRGPLGSIATNVPGIRVSELLPLSARHADKYKIVRSVAHAHNEHSAALSTMATGTKYPRETSAPVGASPDDHPHLGSIVARWTGWRDGAPPFIAIPGVIRDSAGRWPGQRAGFLGKQFDPLVMTGDKKTARFSLPAITLPADVHHGRLEARRSLLASMDRASRELENIASQRELTTLYRQAHTLLTSKSVHEAMDLRHEPEQTHERYGRHLFGQGMLLARRLSEANVPLVTLYWFDPEPAGAGGGEFDSHGRIYHHYPKRLVPPTDRALAALFADLSERGTLDDTLVVVMGEFGRTPKINGGAGRDHWAQCQSILLAGAGITGGSVHGASDRHAAYPISDLADSEDLAQTILHMLGVPAPFELHDQLGRPVPACRGKVIPGLMA